VCPIRSLPATSLGYFPPQTDPFPFGLDVGPFPCSPPRPLFFPEHSSSGSKILPRSPSLVALESLGPSASSRRQPPHGHREFFFDNLKGLTQCKPFPPVFCAPLNFPLLFHCEGLLCPPTYCCLTTPTRFRKGVGPFSELPSSLLFRSPTSLFLVIGVVFPKLLVECFFLWEGFVPSVVLDRHPLFAPWLSNNPTTFLG